MSEQQPNDNQKAAKRTRKESVSKTAQKGVDKKDRSEDVEKLKELYDQLRDLHDHFYSQLTRFTDRMKREEYSLESLTDLGFLCRESENLLDEWRKDVKARKELAGRIIGRRVTERALAGDIEDLTVRGKYATGTPDRAVLPSLPKKGEPEYAEFLSHLEIPKHAIDEGLLKLHWPAIRDMVQERMEEGKPLPPGIKKPDTDFVTTFTRRRNHGERQ